MSAICPVCNNELEDGANACSHCGFRIMGATQSFKPVKLDAGEPAAMRPLTQERVLRVVRGPQTGAEIVLSDGEMVMGRDPHCDIFLNDMTVSRKHATMEMGPKGCIIRDANSFNGVWVNDQMVDACILKSDDVIQLGAFCLVYKER
ncbi:MAG: FHA domain-containing protein [Eggerthellaceae bacterium]|nr:FHA domain-containing protein [Eggerthellaceae bacterium]